MKAIIWLWNPWTKYDNTRHNVWFMFLDFIIKDFNLNWRWEKVSKLNREIFETFLSWEKIFLVKPQTFMNLSWEAVLKIMSFYKIKKDDIIVIYDDISMNFWKIRYREKGSSWWQNWIKNIILKIWDEFKRIKIWIWNNSNFELWDWVLSKFPDIEKEELNTKIFPEAKNILENNFLK